MKTMKKVALATLLIVLLGTSGTAFARINEDPNLSVHGFSVLTSDVRDLQKQIDELSQKNSQLELKLLQLENKTPVTVATLVSSPNDAGQTVRIENLEKRVGAVEGAVNALKTAINKTLDLLTRILKLL